MNPERIYLCHQIAVQIADKIGGQNGYYDHQN